MIWKKKSNVSCFEEVTGMTQGPTMVMRMEHSQMRGILEDLKADIEKKIKITFFELVKV